MILRRIEKVYMFYLECIWLQNSVQCKRRLYNHIKSLQSKVEIDKISAGAFQVH